MTQEKKKQNPNPNRSYLILNSIIPTIATENGFQNLRRKDDTTASS